MDAGKKIPDYELMEDPDQKDESLNKEEFLNQEGDQEMSRTDVILNNDNLSPVPPPPNVQDRKQILGNIEDKPEESKISFGFPVQQVPKNEQEPFFGGNITDLKQSEHLRIAQKKMNNLEEEITKLRLENQELALAGETFKKLSDEYFTTIENMKSKLADQKQMHLQEVELLRKINGSREKQINEYKQQIEDYELRIENDFQRLRKREKELEHRLEIKKMEEVAVVKSKDQMILDLKKRIDEISHESNNFRRKSQENYKQFQKEQQTIRSAVRVLRIALTKLEGDDDSDFGLNENPAPASDDDKDPEA